MCYYETIKTYILNITKCLTQMLHIFRVYSDYSLEKLFSTFWMIPKYFISLPFNLEGMVTTFHGLFTPESDAIFPSFEKNIFLQMTYHNMYLSDKSLCV